MISKTNTITIFLKDITKNGDPKTLLQKRKEEKRINKLCLLLEAVEVKKNTYDDNYHNNATSYNAP